MSCKIVNDIIGCQRLFGGGIEDIIFLYDKSESVVTYSDDLEVSIINGPYIKLKATNWSYNQSVTGDNYSHKLTGTVNLDAVKDFYNAQTEDFIVVFKEKNGDYKVFGDLFGAKLSFNNTIDTSKSSIEVSLETISNTPIKVVDPTNYTPGSAEVPYWIGNGSFCKDGGTGYKITSYVVKVNVNGDPLDVNNKLCSDTGNKQAAYKYTGLSDLNYEIEGIYTIDSGYVNGVEIQTYDPNTCQVTVTGTISVDEDLIEIDTTNDKVKTFTVTSDNNWSVLNKDEITTFSINKTYGPEGDTIVSVFGAKGGDEYIDIINNETNEVVRVQVKSYVISVQDFYDTIGSVRILSIPVECNGTFTVTKNVPDTDIKATIKDNVIYLQFQHTITTATELILTLTHNDYNDEQKTVTVYINAASSTDPNWVIVEEHCEIE